MSFIKEIKKSPFKTPKKRYYFGKIKFGTPYFTPRGFNSSIISFRKLKKRTPLEYNDIIKDRPKFVHSKDHAMYENVPNIRRCKDWIFKVLNTWVWIQIGSPIKISKSDLNWKEKFGTPRFISAPNFMIFFFWWQFCIYYEPPNGSHNYWEMFLWWKNWSDKNIDKAKSTWSWVNNNKSTWDDTVVSKAYDRNKKLKKLGI